MDKDIQRIGVGNRKYPGVDENVLPPEVVDFTFDSIIVNFDSNVKTFDEQLVIISLSIEE